MEKGIMFVGIIALLITFGIIISNPGSQIFEATDKLSGPATVLPSGAVQEVNIGMGSNGYYVPKEIRTKVGTTIKLTGDTNTLVGCMQTMIINGYGISKKMKAGDNTIEFVADKPGVYGISCPMGMGGGTLIVEDQSGQVPANAQPAVKHTCGGGCGGCGG